MKPTTILWCATLVAACASVTTPNQDQQARIAEARALLAQQPERALDVAEKLLADDPDLQAARLVAAEGSMQLALRGGSSAHLHWIDAANAFERGLDGADDTQEPDAFAMLARCRFETGELDLAREAALRAIHGYTTLDLPSDREAAARVMLLAADCDLRQFVAARQEELVGGEPDHRGIVPFGVDTQTLASRAGATLDRAHRTLPAEVAPKLAVLHQWLLQPGEAMRAFERALQVAPDDQALHEKYLAWMTDAGRADSVPAVYARLVREQPTSTPLRWFHGRAVFDRAAQLQQEGNFAGAITSYGKADAIFAEYAAMEPASAAGADQWRASCRFGAVRCALDARELRVAQQQLLAAGEVGGADQFEAHFVASACAVHVALAEAGDLAGAVAFAQQVLQRWPDRWAGIYNNGALAARDLGAQKAKSGDAAAARELWERAYEWYEKAVTLAPDDARFANDSGVMLVYHLHRDHDRARARFDRAIELGKAQLAALPRDADPSERADLEEAVGDAYQNIAVLLRDELRRPFAEYGPMCEQSLRYHPYQQREAAAMLREGRAGAGAAIAAAASASQGGAADALAKRRAEIDTKAKAGDFDGALAVLDELAKQCRDHAPFQLLKGELTLQLAAQARETGRKGVDLLYQDAVTALKRAVEIDGAPLAPRQLLAQAQYEAGDADGAARTLNALLLHAQSQGGAKPDELLALHTARANAAARAYQAKKQANEDDKELLAAARASFKELEQQGKLDTAMLQTWSITEQWAAAPAEAVNVWARALQKAPEDRPLLDALLKTGYEQNQLALVVDALARRTDAIGLWYLGEARFWLADAERQAGKSAEALKTLDAARDAFAAAMAKNADYKNDCEQRLARCVGKKAAIALSADDAASSEKWALESARLRPDQVGVDLGGQETTKRTLLFLVDKFLKRNDLAKVEAIARAAADAVPGDVDLQNNAGLFARDLGDQLARTGKRAEATAMYEQSYKAYAKAVQLDPTNVRLRNDLALIAIHSLERDWDQSKQLLDSAIADGDKTLRDSPPEDANARQQLEEAVGDCYENLALWQLKHGGDAAAAKAAAQQSMKYHPRERRGGARRHLGEAERRLQGK